MSTPNRTFREFNVRVQGESVSRYGRLGLTLDQVIAWESDSFASAQNFATTQEKMTLEVFAASFADAVVWSGQRVVAVLRPQPDGLLDVTRFD